MTKGGGDRGGNATLIPLGRDVERKEEGKKEGQDRKRGQGMERRGKNGMRKESHGCS